MRALLLLPLLGLAACAPSAPRPADGPDTHPAVEHHTTARAASPAGSADAQAMASQAAAAPGGLVVGAYDADATYHPVEHVIAEADALDGQTVHVAGTIRQVCQTRGCWLTMADAQGRMLRVITHDEGTADPEELLFPMDASGARAEVVGTLRVITESVERRRHLAEDAGASEAEVAAITEPSRALSVLATGARIVR